MPREAMDLDFDPLEGMSNDAVRSQFSAAPQGDHNQERGVCMWCQKELCSALSSAKRHLRTNCASFLQMKTVERSTQGYFRPVVSDPGQQQQAGASSREAAGTPQQQQRGRKRKQREQPQQIMTNQAFIQRIKQLEDEKSDLVERLRAQEERHAEEMKFQREEMRAQREMNKELLQIIKNLQEGS